MQDDQIFNEVEKFFVKYFRYRANDRDSATYLILSPCVINGYEVSNFRFLSMKEVANEIENDTRTGQKICAELMQKAMKITNYAPYRFQNGKKLLELLPDIYQTCGRIDSRYFILHQSPPKLGEK